jgi:hypothetical protein
LLGFGSGLRAGGLGCGVLGRRFSRTALRNGALGNGALGNGALRDGLRLAVTLKAQTFSTSLGMLIESNACREVALSFVDTVQLGEDPGSTGVGLL